MVIELWDRCRAPRLPYLDVRDIREKKIPVRNTPGCLPTGTEECWRPQNTEGSVGGRWDLCALDQECEQSRCHWTSVPMQEVPGAASRQHGQGQEERPQFAPGKFRLGRKQKVFQALEQAPQKGSRVTNFKGWKKSLVLFVHWCRFPWWCFLKNFT